MVKTLQVKQWYYNAKMRMHNYVKTLKWTMGFAYEIDPKQLKWLNSDSE